MARKCYSSVYLNYLLIIHTQHICVYKTVFSVCPQRLNTNSMYKAKLYKYKTSICSCILHLIGA